MRTLTALVLSLLLGSTAYAGERAPDFTLRDIDGHSVSLSQYAGQVVLLSFWATWCTPCMAEMPKLQALADTYGPQGFTVLSISTDDARSSSQVKPLIKTKGLRFTVLLDKETSVVAMYNPAKTVPYSVLLDRSGQISSVHSGYTAGDEVALETEIKALLGSTAAVPATETSAAPATPATETPVAPAVETPPPAAAPASPSDTPTAPILPGQAGCR